MKYLFFLLFIPSLIFSEESRLTISEVEVGNTEEFGDNYFFVKDSETRERLFHTDFHYSHRGCPKPEGVYPKWISEYNYEFQGITYEIQGITYEIKGLGIQSHPTDRYLNIKRFALIQNYKDTLDHFTSTGSPTTDKIEGFIIHNGKWIIELVDNVNYNGSDLCQHRGYDKIFTYRILQDEPFYFFEKDGTTRLSWNNLSYSNSYDFVHHNGCCDYATYNPIICCDHIVFFARRSNKWYMVTVEVD